MLCKVKKSHISIKIRRNKVLIRYSVENFLCFNSRSEFSMIPGRGSLLGHHKIKGKGVNDIDVLKTAIIYGANASGKSCLIDSMKFVQDFVLQGTNVESTIPLRKFKLNPESKLKPSRFEFEIKINNENYAYGFSLDYNSVLEEWLYKINKKNEKSIFERYTNKDGQIDVKFKNINFKNEKEEQFLNFIGLGTRPNQLFLTECRQRNVFANVKNIDSIFDTIKWFNNVLTIIFPHSKFQGLEFAFEKSSKLAKIIKEFMKIFDTGIDDIELKPVDFNKIDDIPQKLKEDLLGKIKTKSKTLITNSINKITYALLKDNNGKVTAYKLNSKHKIMDTNEYEYFELNEESDGTQRLLDLIPALIDLFRDDKVFVIDELDRSLHPKLSNNFIDIFLENTRDIHSQLIVTTHESSLLDLKRIRKDEIWFVEKNKFGETSLYSLEEFKPRFDKEIRKNYLLGRFGAVPNINSFEKASIME